MIPGRFLKAATVPAILFLFATAALAQESAPDEPMFDRLRRTVKSDEFSIGVVMQTVGDLVWDRDGTTPGSNGFSIAVARLKVDGALDSGFDYLLHTDFALSPALLDARLSYHLTERLTVDAGLFKTPFSAEYTISPQSLDFVNRSQAVSALRPGRQIGVSLRGNTEDRRFDYRVGVFNGNGRQLSGNDNNRLMVVARATGYPGVRRGTLEVGASFAYSEDNTSSFTGDRLLFGADLRREWDPWLVSAEMLWSDLDPVLGPGRNPFGYQATAGYMLDPGRHQVLIRWDALDLDIGDSTLDQNFLILGYNFWPTQAFELQINYLIPTSDDAEVSDQQILVNFQVAF